MLTCTHSRAAVHAALAACLAAVASCRQAPEEQARVAPSPLASAATFPIVESFQGATATNWTLLGNAVLTSGNPDPAGQGWLRLTANVNSQSGSAIYNQPFSSSAGIVVAFDYATYGGSGADGFTYYLIDGSTSSPTTGALGGSLGYSTGLSACGGSVVAPGVTNGYVGIGFDEYGNFSACSFGNGGPGQVANSVTLRGSGSLNDPLGFRYLTHTQLGQGIATGSRAGARHVRISVVNQKIKVEIDFGAGFTTVVNSYDLGTATGQIAIPSTFKMGFSAGTGGSNNYHELRNLTVSQPATLTLTHTASTTTASAGDTVTYTVTVANDATNPVTGLGFSDPVPAGLTNVTWTAATTGAATASATSGSGNAVAATLNLPRSTSVTFTVTGRVASTAAGTNLVDVATLTPPSDVSNLGNSSATATVAVNKLAPTVGITSSANPSTYGAAITYTATVSGAGFTPTGTVVFTAGGTTISGCGGVSLSGGTATCTTATGASALDLTAGLTIAAAYGGSSAYLTGSATLQQVVTQATPTVAVTSSANPSQAAAAITLTATVSGAGATPTGAVTFSEGGTSLCADVALSGGSATCTTTPAGSGTHTFTASYGGSARYAVADGTLSQVVQLRTPTIALTTSANPAAFGALTLTATVGGSGPTPTGGVTFSTGATTLCNAVPLSGAGVATCSPSLAVGAYTVSANYGGSGVYAAASSSRSQTVTQATGAISLSSSNAYAAAGAGFTLTATVTPAGASGTVTFKNGSSVLGTGPLAGGVATLTVPSLPGGSYPLSAYYPGDASVTSATSSTLVQQMVGTFPISEPFRNATAAGWTLLGSAKLTSSNPDPSGAGWLQLTGAVNTQAGTAIYDVPFSSAAGIVVAFDYATWGGNGADGFTYYLIDGATTAPTTGAAGGSLGYSGALSSCSGGTATAAGVTNGYVGIGFDEYGNYTNCLVGIGGPGAVANTVGLRGSGSLFTTTGFRYLTHTVLPAGIGTGSRAGARHVRISIVNRKIKVELDAGSGFQTILNSYDLSSATGQVALPPTFKMGFSAATGGLNNYHEIRNLNVAQPVTLALTHVASPTSAAVNGSVTYTVTVTNDNTNDVAGVAFADPVPAALTGVTWTASSAGGASAWAASGSGNTIAGNLNLPKGGSVSFTVSGTVSASAAGTTLTHAATVTTPAGITNLGSSSASASVTVARTSATVALASSANPSTYGDAITYIASVSGAGRTPTGTVSFTMGGAAITGCTAVPLSAGVATCVTPTGGSAVHATTGSTVAAAYAGDSAYLGASDSLTQVVDKASPAVTLASSVNPSVIGAAVTLTARVIGAGAIPTGALSFQDTPTTLCDGLTLDGAGAASCTTSALPGGSRTLSVSYAGDGNYLAAGRTLLQVVNKAAVTVTLVSGTLARTYDGQPKAVSATTSPAGLAVIVTYGGGEAAPVGAGSYAVVATVDDPRYEGSASGTLVIDKATPAIAWSNPAAIQAGTPLGAMQLSASTSVLGTLAYSPGPGTILGVGTGQTLRADFLPSDPANYRAVSQSVTIDVVRRTQTVTVAALHPVVYGAPDFSVGAVVSSGMPLAYASDMPQIASVSEDGIVHVVSTGYATITVTQAGDASTAPATAQQVVFVDQAPLTVQALDASRPYDTDNPAFSARLRGFVNGETAAVVSGEPLLSTEADRSSPAGSYPIHVGAGTLIAPNYRLVFSDGTLAVGLASQTVTFHPLPGVTYGDSPFPLTATGGRSGNPIVYTSSDPAVAAISGATVTIVGAGEATITATQAGDGNYGDGVARQVLTVKPATLLVTADDASRPWGESDPAFTATVSGFVNGEDVDVLRGAPVFTTTATVESPVGSYPISVEAGDLSAANYRFAFAGGTLGVVLATQTIGFDPLPVHKYGDPSFRLTAVPGRSGLPVVFTSTDPSVAVVEGSTLRIVGAGETTIVAEEESDGVYASTRKAQLLRVRPAVLTVDTPDLERPYGQANPPLVRRLTGLVYDDGPTVLAGAEEISTTATAASPAGDYAISVEPGNLSAANYDLRFADGTLRVTPAAQAISLSPPVYTYGDPPVDLGRLATGGETGNPVTFTVTAGPGALEDGRLVLLGAGEIHVLAHQDGDHDHLEAQLDVAIGVLPAAAAVTLALPSLEQVYDGSPRAVTVETDPAGLPVTVTYDGAADAPVNAGTYDIVATVADPNYVGAASGLLHVARAAQVVAFSPPAAKTFGDAPIELTEYTTRSPSGQPLQFTCVGAGTLDRSLLSFTAAGRVTVTVVQEADLNHDAGEASASIEVAQRPVAVSFDPGSLAATYDGAPHAVIVSTDPADVAVAVTYDGAATPPVHAGRYAVAAAVIDTNYVGGRASTLAVARAPVALDWSPPTPMEWGAPLGPAQLAASTRVPGAITYTPAAGTVLDVGPQQALRADFVPADAVDYDAASVTVAIDVVPRAQEVSFATLAPRTYGAADFGPGATASLGGAMTYTSDTPEVATITAAGLVHVVGAGTATITATQAGDTVTQRATAAQPLTVEKAALTVRAVDESRGYGEPNPALEVAYEGFVRGETAAAVLSGAPEVTTLATAESPVGSYPITAALGTLASANYRFLFADGTLGVGLANQPIAFRPAGPATWGDPDLALVATGGGSGNPVTFESLTPEVATVNDGVVHLVGAGEATLVASQAGSDGYAPGHATQRLVVNPATLVVTAHDATRRYGEPNPELSATYAGFVNGDTADVLAGAPELATRADVASAAGSYAITVAGGTLAARNYRFTFVAGTLGVEVAPQAIAFDPAPATTYGAAPFALHATGGASGNPVTFASANPAVAAVTAEGVVTIAGAGEALLLASQAGDGNHAATSAAQLLRVRPAPLTVTVATVTRGVGEANPAVLPVYDGLVNGDTGAALQGEPEISVAADLTSPIGRYPITVGPGNLFSGNYAFTFLDGTLVVHGAGDPDALPCEVNAQCTGERVCSAGVCSVAPSSGRSGGGSGCGCGAGGGGGGGLLVLLAGLGFAWRRRRAR